MTILEIILIAIIWAGYGIYAASVTTIVKNNKAGDAAIVYIVYICIAPGIFVYRSLCGAFAKTYKVNNSDW